MTTEDARSGAQGAPAASTHLSLEELFQKLRKYDSEWLTDTLSKRWHDLEESKQLSSQVSIWTLDLTMPTLPDGLQVSKFIQDFHSWDWSSTKLGAMSTWSLDLRRMVNTCLWDQQAAALWVGPEHLAIYNEYYADLLGSKHPHALGQPYLEVWSELESNVLDILNACRQGTPLRVENASFIMEPYGQREEIWISFALSPVPDTVNGGIMGIYNNVQYNTAREILSRRMSTLLTLGHSTSQASDTKDFWKQIIPGLEANLRDVPFAAVYAFTPSTREDPHGSDTASSAGSNGHDDWHWTLAGSLGLPVGPDGLPKWLDATKAGAMFTSDFHTSLTRGKTLVLKDSTFPENFRGAKCRVHGDACTSAVLFPISPTHHEDIYGFVLLGINPLAKYDDSYQQFIKLLGRQCATSLASIVLIADEQRRAKIAAKMAAQDRIKLTNKLVETQLESAENKARFKAIADVAPIAMIHLDTSGDILYANQQWIDLTQHPVEEWSPLSWRKAVFSEDLGMADAQWLKVLSGTSVRFEMRWRADYTQVHEVYIDKQLVIGPIWTLVTARPELYPDGTVKGVIGCVTDISRQKWIERLQESRVQEAYHQKKNQENFMDMICHEARNPLSAIMLCTESILTSTRTDMSKSMIEQHVEAAQTIMTCAQHQKRVIDDVLTISKLDSDLLTICPVDVQPVEAIRQALKMFDMEMHKHDITQTFSIHPSLGDLRIDWLRFDCDRLLQVFINLITNAIKFTQGQADRRIDVSVSASANRPESSLSGVPYFSSPEQSLNSADSDATFLALEVVDTGCGISATEMQHLFQKFRQASPKTHIKYGGSGLGLFISQQLTKMLGGAIGALSRESGTAFAFYVQTARSQAPGPKLSLATRKSAVETLARTGHILVVEDNLINQKVLCNQLKRLGYQVSAANNGLEALEHISQSRFCKPGGVPLDIMLLDVEMPICNGLECAQKVRESQAGARINGHLPIIGVTANARREQQQAALNAGMDSMLTKPFRLMELSDTMQEAMHKFYG